MVSVPDTDTETEFLSHTTPDKFNSKWFLLVTTRSSAFLYQQGNFLPSSLCRQHQEKLEELARLEENLHQETQAKENRNLQIVELEQTLAKESQRASDLKVTRETHSGAIHKGRRFF